MGKRIDCGVATVKVTCLPCPAKTYKKKCVRPTLTSLLPKTRHNIKWPIEHNPFARTHNTSLLKQILEVYYKGMQKS